jgi:hypothetical protein
MAIIIVIGMWIYIMRSVAEVVMPVITACDITSTCASAPPSTYIHHHHHHPRTPQHKASPVLNTRSRLSRRCDDLVFQPQLNTRLSQEMGDERQTTTNIRALVTWNCHLPLLFSTRTPMLYTRITDGHAACPCLLSTV